MYRDMYCIILDLESKTMWWYYTTIIMDLLEEKQKQWVGTIRVCLCCYNLPGYKPQKQHIRTYMYAVPLK